MSGTHRTQTPATQNSVEEWYRDKDQALTGQARRNLAAHAIEPGAEAYHLGNPDYVTAQQMERVCPQDIDFDRYATLANGYVDYDEAAKHWDDAAWWSEKAQAMWNSDDTDTIPDEGVYWTECDLDYAEEDQTSVQENEAPAFAELWQTHNGTQARIDHGRIVMLMPAEPVNARVRDRRRSRSVLFDGTGLTPLTHSLDHPVKGKTGTTKEHTMNVTTTQTIEEQVAETFRRECHDHGIRDTRRKWAARIIRAWNAMLDGETMGAQAMCELKALTKESLPIRDSLIIASMDKTHKIDQLANLAGDAHTPRTRHTMNEILTDTYETGAVDRQRCAKAVRLLDRLAKREDVYAVQPLAMAAWLDWITGRAGYAMTHAIKALDLDESCSLAALILAAAGQGARPAYLD
ncbi:hypothetical protein [Bifidobacterium bifidum]|uniref:hypothetical protein n=1 Tax=Bifidobacterium bifidum TaxID=1681 RepID=UPI001D628EE1|nr:hypothetical protein [Bifidobacterium bifidum]MBX9162534.1 DUF4192 family protein [Bifidobacterium bifidum]